MQRKLLSPSLSPRLALAVGGFLFLASGCSLSRDTAAQNDTEDRDEPVLTADSDGLPAPSSLEEENSASKGMGGKTGEGVSSLPEPSRDMAAQKPKGPETPLASHQLGLPPVAEPSPAAESKAETRGFADRAFGGKVLRKSSAAAHLSFAPQPHPHPLPYPPPHPGHPFLPTTDPSGEGYASVRENGFIRVEDEPLSTFGVDVDQASYANIRRFLNQGTLPPEDAVRLEECVNYFRYAYAAPKRGEPFGITLEAAASPFHRGAQLVLVGLQGRERDEARLPPSNLVFLLDVSGSMNHPDKLPLLQRAFGLLVERLRPQDRVSIVVYAGAAGLVLPPTSGADKEAILASLNRLSAGGSTAGGAGLQLAYATARSHFLKNGNNRVILATDGDFNVGPSGEDELQRLIEKERKSGVFLSVLGFGQGNLQDAKMELLADKGNGQYAYIDGLLEARKVLVEQMGGTLHTLAKDVKMQVEFNPAKVAAYRLLGYENRMLEARDFNDDKKDAGELGLGHRVTALYEIIPVGSEAETVAPGVDPLKYGASDGEGEGTARPVRQARGRASKPAYADEWLTAKFRYKEPDGEKSQLLVRVLKGKPVKLAQASENLRFAASVAGFAQLLRGSEHAGAMDWAKVLELGRGARGEDANGYRAEFLRLAALAESLQGAANGNRNAGTVFED